MKIPVEDINLTPSLNMMPDFNRKASLMKTDKVYEVQITNIVALTEHEKLFRLQFIHEEEAKVFHFLPGQFVMVEVPGFGEVPISLSASTAFVGQIELCIRKAGKVTGVLHNAKIGSTVGIRGPFGTHFPMEKMTGKDILLIAGGLGIVPLRGPIFWINEHRSQYGKIYILYGVKTPSQILFEYQFKEWEKIYDCEIEIISEEKSPGWSGKTGMITDLLKDKEMDVQNTYAVVCGPPVMFKYVCADLSEKGIPMNRMYVDLERRMHCGMGKCCRCMVGSTFTCVDGPVMDYWTVMNLKEAI